MAIGYQLKITIRGSKPPIWRRVIVPEHIAFCDLDDIIEKIFGWTHSHLYEFYIKDWGMRITGAPIMEEEDNAEECIDSWMKEGSEILYTYDFGDNWEHLIKIEKIVEYEHRYPTVLKSKGPNMIEDCGGLWGFYGCEDEAEPFDLKAVNAEFESWVLPIAEPIEELMGFCDEDDGKIDEFEDVDFDRFMKFAIENGIDSEEKLWQVMENKFGEFMAGVEEEEQNIRDSFGKQALLANVYEQYTKENLVEIAKLHKLFGYSKYNKQRLIEWLVKNVLEEQHMLNLLLNASKDELELFESAIEEDGIFVSENLIAESLLLSSYGGFIPSHNFYNVPMDVQDQYGKLMTDSMRKTMKDVHKFEEICKSCVFLYGVISMPELEAVCEKYGIFFLSSVELQTKIMNMLKCNEFIVLHKGYLMDMRLMEDDIYLEILKEQEKVERYLPDEEEEFLAFGEHEVQEVNEDTTFFLEYIMKEANLDYPAATLAVYLIQEAIRMNQGDEELFAILSELGCSFRRAKQFDKAEQMLKKFENRTRKWEYNGHTSMELNRGIVEFPVNRNVYPNDPCPCGSGKKYKYCCGKRK